MPFSFYWQRRPGVAGAPPMSPCQMSSRQTQLIPLFCDAGSSAPSKLAFIPSCYLMLQSRLFSSTSNTRNTFPPTTNKENYGHSDPVKTVSTASTASTAPTEAANSADDDLDVPPLPSLVNRLNLAISNHPYESLISLIGLEIATIFGCYGAILASDLHFSPEFALAFALSRPLRRVRFPLEVAVAAALSKVLPSLCAIKISNLAAVIPASMRKGVQIRAKSEGHIGRGMRFMQDTIDRYGASYFIGARMVGVSLVLALYQAIRMGIDVQPFLDSVGVGQVGNVLADWAAAVVLSSSMYPLSISLTAFVAPVLATARKNIVGAAKRRS